MRRYRLLLPLIASFHAATAHAGWLAMPQLHDLGNGYQLGPQVGVAGTYTDNYYYAPSGTVTVNGTSVQTGIELIKTSESLVYRLDAAAEYATFGVDVGPDHYLDSSIGLGADWALGTRHHLSASGGQQLGHDAFGIGRTQGSPLVSGEFDKWRLNSAAGKYRFGATEATVNAELRASYADKQYTSNLAATSVLDYSTRGFGTTLLFNYSPKTSLLADLAQDTIRFDANPPGGPDRNSVETRAGVGARWQAAAKTSGDVRVGYFKREFESGFATVSGVDWAGTITWAPVVSSRFSLQTGRRSTESYFANTAVINDRFVGLSWAQYWAAKFSTALSYTLTQSEFEGISRTDHVQDVGLLGKYDFSRSLALVGSVASSNRRSTSSVSAYRATRAFIGLQFTP